MIHQPHNRWKTYDIIIEGLSLIQSYRASFRDEITRTRSIDDLIKHLETRNHEALSMAPVHSMTPIGNGADAQALAK